MHELTRGEQATLSNTICGELESARSLERMGLLTIEEVARNARGQLAFFELTEAGEDYVARHFTVVAPSFHYTYDFGDDWRPLVEVKTLDTAEGQDWLPLIHGITVTPYRW